MEELDGLDVTENASKERLISDLAHQLRGTGRVDAARYSPSILCITRRHIRSSNCPATLRKITFTIAETTLNLGDFTSFASRFWCVLKTFYFLQTAENGNKEDC